MTTICLETEIDTAPEVCFDVARSVDTHLISAEGTQERVVAGRTSGLCESGDIITWEATHFGIRQRLTVEITKFERPRFFEDKMIKGAFKSMRHEHHFDKKNGGTLMKDVFVYETPFGILGRVFDKLILKRHMIKFLLIRNRVIKSMAEKN